MDESLASQENETPKNVKSRIWELKVFLPVLMDFPKAISEVILKLHLYTMSGLFL